jgi:hypothetical protein
VRTSSGGAGVTGLRTVPDGYIRTALTGAHNGLPEQHYRRGRAPAWARRVLEAAEAQFGRPEDDAKPRGRPRKREGVCDDCMYVVGECRCD